MRRYVASCRESLVLQVNNITKSYYSLVAVDGVSFEIPAGEVVGLLGPNGAGKTTLLKLIAGFLQPDDGEITPTGGSWPNIAFKPERLLFPNRMRVHKYLEMIARLARVQSPLEDVVDRTLEQLNLLEHAGKRIKDCSKGMRQRLSLAQALIGDAALLLLDEPTNGLDPEGQSAICQLIRELNAAGRTILMSSHQLQEVTEVCQRLVILKDGRVHYASSMEEALTLRPSVSIQTTAPVEAIGPTLTALSPSIAVSGHTILLHDEAIVLRRHVLSFLLAAGHDIQYVSQERVTLEEIYAEAVQ